MAATDGVAADISGPSTRHLMLVEAYGPAADASAALAWTADRLGPVRVHGVIVVPGDEVVFYLVAGPSAGEVRRVFATLGVESLRVVPAQWAVQPR